MIAVGIQTVYFIAAIVFILGLKQMSSPKTARKGVVLAGWGMLAAVAVTFFTPGMLPGNILLILLAITLGTGLRGFQEPVLP